MSQLDARFVKQGYWLDLAKGSVLGKTITTDTSTGNVVIAFLAVLTTLGTTHFWNLATFTIHQVRADTKSADGLFRQQQALLRTLPAPSALFSDWAKLWWVWRKRTDHAFHRSLFMMILGLLFTAATITVGIFSSYIVDSSSIHILVQGTSCSPLNMLDDSAFYDYFETALQKASTYARDCYTNSTIPPDRCRIFVKPRLDIHLDRIDCPYENSLCKNITHPAITLDSGLVDLAQTLGINSPTRDRIRWRRKTTYSILELNNHYKVNSASDWPCFKQNMGRDAYDAEEVMTVQLGDFYIASSPGEACNDTSTFVTSLLKGNVSSDIDFWRSPPWNFTVFTPLQEMNTNDADLQLISIFMHNLLYNSEVNDPMYAAHRKIERVNSHGSVATYYQSDFPAIVLACQSQLSSLPPLTSLEQYPGMSESQLTLLQFLSYLHWNFNAAAAAHRLLTKDLAGAQGVIDSLPDDQWVKEVTMLEQTTWSSIQVGLSDHAKGYESLVAPGTNLYSNTTSAGEKHLCGVQKMESPGGFVNISVFALTFVITFCFVITLVDMVLLKFLISWKRKRNDTSPRLDAWVQDGVFQLQRRAYEAYGKGVWERLDKEVPATLDNAELTTFRSRSKPCSLDIDNIGAQPVECKL
ncbi:hypothetical protein K491DRAFT_613575 [Lophiostoma macrostomum CBS 122681]|uniref:Uncharacterized protein n=1 Tax=Lophiostoma macrostomum CBS 122681 TaxID=1314788 RepID=A0A6A6SN58_9PLEO|nr:hypothetical protein K491DRAFT_613575 [Lophiostoma macrostomum CBS 122681]